MLSTPYVKADNYDKVYEPAEDSFLLLDSLEIELDYLSQRFHSVGSHTVGYCPIVVELGCGSGILSTFMMQNSIPVQNSLYFPIDLNPWALKVTAETIINNAKETIQDDQHSLKPAIYSLLQMDLDTGLRPQTVDMLVFNPPYVPADHLPCVPETSDDVREINDEWLDLALLGGPEGMDITLKVLKSLDHLLTPHGVAYILFCARNNPDKIVKEWTAKGWDIQLIEKRKAGWEVLSVYKFTHQRKL